MFKHDWKFEEVREIYQQPFPDLMFQAQSVHRESFPGNEIQRSTLLSIKTGACSENCSYCAQSGHYSTAVEREKLLTKENVLEKAKMAKEQGSTRFCMGAAWRGIRDGKNFDLVLDIVRAVHELDMQVCCTLGMLNEKQASRLKDAGCHTYNHNLDTSPEYYPSIVSTHSYEERLDTLKSVQKAGLRVCCGGILGMGESQKDRIKLLVQLANQNPHPDSVPINLLIPMQGTPLENQGKLDSLEFVRTVATARILMPYALVRLGAGRTEMSDEMQALCFTVGANSVFSGEKLLTAPNPGDDKDGELLSRLGMSFMKKAPVDRDEPKEKMAANA